MIEYLITILESAGIFGGLVQLLVMLRGLIDQAFEMCAQLNEAFA